MRTAIRVVRALLLAGLIVLIPLALASFWVRQEIYSENQYVRTMSSLAANPRIQAAVSDRILLAIEQEIERVNLPATDKAVVQALYDQFRGTIVHEMTELMASETFQQLWTDLNRRAHPYLKALLTGDQIGSMGTREGYITFDLLPIYHEVDRRLHEAGIDLLDRLPSQPEQLELNFFAGERLVEAQEAVQLLNDTLVVASILIVVFAVLFVALARNRLRAFYWLAIAVGVSFVLLLVILWFGRRATVNALSSQTSRGAAATFYETLIDTLRFWTEVGVVAAIALGILFALFAIVGRREERSEAFAGD